MGSIRRLRVLLLLVFFVYLCVFAASSIIQKGLSPESSNGNDLGDKDIQQHEHGIRNDNGKNYADGGIAYGNKIAQVSGVGAAHTGGSAGRHGNNGGSGYLYGGGAASNHDPRPHHATSSCNRHTVALFTFILTAVAPLAHL